MILKADQERVKNLLRETITMLCKNGLHFKSEFCIEGLIGVTLDREEVFLVNLKESYQALQTDKVALDNESTCEDLSMQAVRNVIEDEVRHAGDSVARVCVNDGDQQSVQQPRISIKNVRNKENVSDNSLNGIVNRLKSSLYRNGRKRSYSSASSDPFQDESALQIGSQIENCESSAGSDRMDSWRSQSNESKVKGPEKCSSFTNGFHDHYKSVQIETDDFNGSRIDSGLSTISTSKKLSASITKLDSIGADNGMVCSTLTRQSACRSSEDDEFVDGGMDLIPSFHIKEEPEASDGPDEGSLLQFSSQLSMDPSQSYDFLASHVDNFLASRVGQSSSHTLGSSSLEAFSSDAYQARQTARRARIDLDLPAQRGSFNCHECGKTLSSMHNLCLHETTVHKGLFQYTCPICKKGLRQERDLRGHLANRHDWKKDFKCSICSHEFGYKRNLKQHMVSYHGWTGPVVQLPV